MSGRYPFRYLLFFLLVFFFPLLTTLIQLNFAFAYYLGLYKLRIECNFFRFGLGTEALERKSPIGLDPEVTLLPKILKRNGYKVRICIPLKENEHGVKKTIFFINYCPLSHKLQTHLIGKWHLGFCQPGHHPLRRGFETFYGFHSAQIGYTKHYSDYFDGFESANDTSTYSTIVLFQNTHQNVFS